MRLSFILSTSCSVVDQDQRQKNSFTLQRQDLRIWPTSRGGRNAHKRQVITDQIERAGSYLKLRGQWTSALNSS